MGAFGEGLVVFAKLAYQCCDFIRLNDTHYEVEKAIAPAFDNWNNHLLKYKFFAA